jgi:formate dehydrogenase maturation protein FdhE
VGPRAKALISKTKGGRMEKIVALCRACGQCPVVKITDTEVEIGEGGNSCVLTKAQWEVLREKILKGEV